MGFCTSQPSITKIPSPQKRCSLHGLSLAVAGASCSLKDSGDSNAPVPMASELFGISATLEVITAPRADVQEGSQ
jgi:hypothetical protein